MAAKYFTMVGQLQWLVTLGKFDLHPHVVTMCRFRAAPRQRHMDRLKRIYAYAIWTKDYAVRVRTDQPDYSFLPEQDFDWTYSVYGDVHEILPDDMPEPLGEAVVTTTAMDANLNHCLATGKSLTECLHFVNKTPVDWYSKKQTTVETATYALRISMTLLDISVLAESLRSLSIAPLLLMLSSRVLTNCFPLFIGYASATRVSLPTNT